MQVEPKTSDPPPEPEALVGLDDEELDDAGLDDAGLDDAGLDDPVDGAVVAEDALVVADVEDFELPQAATPAVISAIDITAVKIFWLVTSSSQSPRL